jgi:dipeptidyl-peptidase-4
MKKLFLLVACVVLSFAKLQAQASLNLKDIANGHYYPEQIYGVNPMNDGETYTQISPDRKRIVRFSFKTGKEVGVVFDAEKARGKEKIRGIDGYIM